MSMSTFLLGFVCGAVLASLAFALPGWLLKLRNPLGADEQYLLKVARAAGGRLIVKEEPAPAGPPVLRLLEVPDQQTLFSKGQVAHLQNRGLLKPDPSGMPSRYLLTSDGWESVKRLQPLTLAIKRTGTWFNSVSRRPPR